MNSSLPGLQRLAVAFLALAPLGAPLFAQTTATTTPVGFITVTVPAAVAPTSPGSKGISIPLYNAPAFTSAVASVDTANAFTMSGATWSANQFTAAPHFVRVKSGAQAGRFFLILSHTGSQLTVDTGGKSLVGVVAANDSCEIIPGNTLGSVFGTTTPVVQAAPTAEAADRVYLWNGTGWDSYFHNGTNWRNFATADNKNGVVIYPDEGILIQRQKDAPLALTVMGTVPSGTERTELPSAGSSFLGNRFPVDMQLSNLGLHQTADWKSGISADQADTVRVKDDSGWSTYFYNGTAWRKAGNLKNQDSSIIPAGSSIFITRSASSAAILAQSLPYTP